MIENGIKVPEDILIEEVESQTNGKEGLLDTYIKNYNKCISIKNNITNYIFGKLDDESIDELNKDIIDVKEYKYINIISNYIDMDINLLKERTMQLCINLGLNQNDIDEARLKAIEDQINSQEKVKLTDEYLKNIVDELNNSEPINTDIKEDIEHINKECKPILVVVYNSSAYSWSSKYSSYDKFEEKVVYDVYFTRQPLSGIVRTNGINRRWIKIYQFDDNLTDCDIETIKSEVIVNLKPRNFKRKDIKKNDKWLTASMIKEVFNISSGTKTQTIKNIYNSLGYGHACINEISLFNKRLYSEAEKLYNKEIKYNEEPNIKI